MKKLLPLVILSAFILSACYSSARRFCLRDACYSVEVMTTDAGRAQGLMFRKGLDHGRGMFFVFDTEDVYPFWMKNMLFAIDILWFDKDKRVVHLESHGPPCHTDACPVYTPSAKAMYVLEIPAGDAAKHGIRTGDLLH